jgi:membrane protein YqaA with SNARE-associated domain
LGESFVRKIFGDRLYTKGEALFNRYGFFAVLLGEPYKLVCWLAGIFNMPLLTFLIASVIARGVRIGIFVFFGGCAEEVFKLKMGAGGLEPPTGRL